jgi:hypothetical protein
MGAIVGTKVYAGELAGETRLLLLTATVASESDTITLTAANHGGVTEIVGIVGAVITGGIDAAFTFIQVSYSGLVITVASFGEDGLAATDFTGTTIALTLEVKTTA